MPVERCTRCGTARRGDLQVCVRCEQPFAGASDPDVDMQRPAAPSTFQTHGTMGLMIVIGVVILGAFLAFSSRDVGPFKGTIVGDVKPSTKIGHVLVTVTVTNAGERAGRGNCHVAVVNQGGIARPESAFLTPKIPGGGSVQQDVDVPTANGSPSEVRCS